MNHPPRKSIYQRIKLDDIKDVTQLLCSWMRLIKCQYQGGTSFPTWRRMMERMTQKSTWPFSMTGDETSMRMKAMKCLML